MKATSTLAPLADEEANLLLQTNPTALLIGLLLDEHMSIDLAYLGPYRLKQRLGELNCQTIAKLEEERLVEHFCMQPALHRFCAVMARRTFALANHIIEFHEGNPESIWEPLPSATELSRRLSLIPGFDEEKTQIAIALLAKRMGVTPDGWQEAAGVFADDQPRSIADIDGPVALEMVRAWISEQARLNR